MSKKIDNWKFAIAAISCRLTPAHKEWRDGREALHCLMFLDGQKEPHSLLVKKEEGFVYAQLGDDAAIIIDYEKKCEHLIIPGTIAGRRVFAVSGLSYRDDLKKVTIEEGILQICYDFLHVCSNLECVELPASLVRIAGDFCVGDSKLSEFKVNENSFSCTVEEGVLFDQTKRILIRYPEAKLAECYEIPENVKAICPNAFTGTIYLKNVILPKKLERITRSAFASCGIQEIEFPDTLKVIEDRAFFQSGLREVQIPDSVEQIGNMAFAYSSSLTDIKLPAELNAFGEYVFQECHALFKAQLSKGIQKLEGTFYECWDLEHVYVPPSVTEIDKNAFAQDNKKVNGPGMEPLTIHGEKGSFIEKYAKEKGFSFEAGLWSEDIKSHWVNEEAGPESLKEAAEGDKVTFGKYFLQKHRKQKDPVLWRVLKKENEKLLLLSEYCLKYSSFDEKSCALWKDSKLRKWLNEEFMEGCFSAIEKDAFDNIFCLSADEAETLMTEAKSREARLTPYARACCGKEYEINWWLRTEGELYSTAFVWDEGSIDTRGEDARKRLGVRPALWVDLNKL